MPVAPRKPALVLCEPPQTGVLLPWLRPGRRTRPADRLGNRSALEWVVDQYRVTEDERSGIKSDPNREDDPQYIVRLVGQVVRVGIETVRIVRSLPPVFPHAE